MPFQISVWRTAQVYNQSSSLARDHKASRNARPSKINEIKTTWVWVWWRRPACDETGSWVGCRGQIQASVLVEAGIPGPQLPTSASVLLKGPGESDEGAKYLGGRKGIQQKHLPWREGRTWIEPSAFFPRERRSTAFCIWLNGSFCHPPLWPPHLHSKDAAHVSTWYSRHMQPQVQRL